MQDLYVALSGALAMERRMAIVANNIANSGTAGYRADHVTVRGVHATPDFQKMRMSVASELEVAPPRQQFTDILYASLNEDAIDFSEGVPRQTDSPTDVLIRGDAFFAVNTPGGERYTRQGAFALNPDGVLVTLDGMAIADDSGREIEIASPSFSIGGDGKVLDNDGDEIATLKVVEIPDKRMLVKEGNARFRLESARGRSGTRPKQADMDKVELKQGWLEGSNIQIVDELIGMIQIERAYQSFQKAIQTSDSMSGQLISAVSS